MDPRDVVFEDENRVDLAAPVDPGCGDDNVDAHVARPRQRLPHGLVSSRRLGTRHPPCNVFGPATIRLWRTVQQVAATDLEGGAGAA